MHLTRNTLTALAALTLAALPVTASAHDGDHPFKSCAQAYDNGYSRLGSGDDHYGPELDPDGDGIACDEPPAGFIPRDHTEVGGDTTPWPKPPRLPGATTSPTRTAASRPT
ncbi:excalibur calcium-binding domain-containing protein [Streptomyces albogriseolus]